MSAMPLPPQNGQPPLMGMEPDRSQLLAQALQRMGAGGGSIQSPAGISIPGMLPSLLMGAMGGGQQGSPANAPPDPRDTRYSLAGMFGLGERKAPMGQLGFRWGRPRG